MRLAWFALAASGLIGRCCADAVLLVVPCWMAHHRSLVGVQQGNPERFEEIARRELLVSPADMVEAEKIQSQVRNFEEIARRERLCFRKSHRRKKVCLLAK